MCDTIEWIYCGDCCNLEWIYHSKKTAVCVEAGVTAYLSSFLIRWWIHHARIFNDTWYSVSGQSFFFCARVILSYEITRRRLFRTGIFDTLHTSSNKDDGKRIGLLLTTFSNNIITEYGRESWEKIGTKNTLCELNHIVEASTACSGKKEKSMITSSDVETCFKSLDLSSFMDETDPRRTTYSYTSHDNILGRYRLSSLWCFNQVIPILSLKGHLIW